MKTLSSTRPRPVHDDADTRPGQRARELLACELAALVAVEDLGTPLLQGTLQRRYLRANADGHALHAGLTRYF